MNCKLYLEKVSKYTIHQYKNQPPNKSILSMTVIYKKTDENNKSITVKIKTL